MSAQRDTRPTEGLVLIAYDGSEEAIEALEFAAALLPRARAVVLTVWKPMIEEALSPAAKPPVTDLAGANQHQREAARQLAREGARLAAAAGLTAEPLTLEADGPVWAAIDSVAQDRDAVLIVCGTRRTGLRSALPGNLSNTLVTHASRAVLVVPSAKARASRLRDVEEERREHRAVPT
jgi:nucleotide-binding universal stress UspA family protein